MKISVIGEGAWGCAIAYALSKKQPIALWCADSANVESITTQHMSSYLPETPLPENIIPTLSMESLTSSDVIFVTTPVKYLSTVLHEALVAVRPDQTWILMCKGIDLNLCLPVDIAHAELGESLQVAYLAGPSFAHDLIAGAPTALVLASTQPLVIDHLFPDYVHLSYTNDLVGVQWCAVLKNVMSIALGIADGLGCMENTKAFLFVQAFQEIRNFALAHGAEPATLLTPAGLGDFFMTATSTQSRNFKIGRALGSGRLLQQVLADYPYAEGPHTINILAQKQLASYPLLALLTRIMTGFSRPHALIDAL